MASSATGVTLGGADAVVDNNNCEHSPRPSVETSETSSDDQERTEPSLSPAVGAIDFSLKSGTQRRGESTPPSKLSAFLARPSAFDMLAVQQHDTKAHAQQQQHNVLHRLLAQQQHLQQLQQHTDNNNNNSATIVASHQPPMTPQLLQSMLLAIQANNAAAQPRMPLKADTADVAAVTKSVRPFKAYNPTDPLSALQLTRLDGNNNSSVNINNNSNNIGTTSNLMQQYKNMLMANTSSPPQQQVSSTSDLNSPLRGALLTGATALPFCRPIDANNNLSTLIANVNAKQQLQQHMSAAAAQPASSPCVPRKVDSESGSPSKTPRRSSMARNHSSTSEAGDLPKDEAYWERRRKNNEAAKRSRDSRRHKEDEIAMRAAMLEQENLRLRIEVAQLKTDKDKMRAMIVGAAHTSISA